MSLPVLVACLLSAVCVTEGVQKFDEKSFQWDPNCDPRYVAIDPHHTMCILGDVGVDVPPSQADKELILKMHNDARAAVTPPAAHMMKVYWDDDVAEVAGKWARQCVFGHDKQRAVLSLPGLHIGQNAQAGSFEWYWAVNTWLKEIKYWVYGVGSTTGNWEDVGHYTQAVAAATQRIGCAQANCSGTPYNFCNYATGPQGVSRPYVNSSQSCTECAQSCDGNLCDCHGKLCLNRAPEMDRSTCQCVCDYYFEGDTCEIPVCGGKRCKNGGTLDKSTCQCNCDFHYEGDLCETAVCGGKRCHHHGTLDKTTCTCSCYNALYSGETCETLNCPADGLDFWHGYCGPDKSYEKSACTAYWNIKYECPFWCGICDHNCGDKQCYNGGTMNYNDCTCSCAKGYKGDECDEQVCGGKKCQNGGTLDESTCQCACDFFHEGDLCETAVCGGKRCQNRGTLNKTTCECKCFNALYTGDICDTLNCPADGLDFWHGYCGPDKSYEKSACTAYWNIKYECPFWCGICDHNCGDKQCYNGGTMNYNDCTCSCPTGFNGDECKGQECGGKKCQNGGTLDESTCQCTCDFFHEGDLCETAVCGGKRCQNSGTLNKTTCSCKCYNALYSGDVCDILNCPADGLDFWHGSCGPDKSYKKSACTTYYNIKYECPFWCDICDHNCGDKQCYNGGTMNYNDCTCSCPGDFQGDECKEEKCLGRECANGGTLDESSCTCSCPDLFEGDTCETPGECKSFMNAALNKAAKQSSTLTWGSVTGHASLAVDGNFDTDFNTRGACTHSEGTSNEWWVVDLGQEYEVNAVVITNRGDCCGWRLNNFIIEVFADDPELPDSTPLACYQHAGSAPDGLTKTYKCTSPQRGRYVRIKQASDFLQLCEVQVLVPKTS